MTVNSLPAEPAGFIEAPVSLPDDGAVYFRREFTAGEGLRRATLAVTALGIVVPYVNGERAGDEVLAPGWTSYRHRVRVSRHDVTRQVAAGRNVLAAVVGDGWAVGPLSWKLRRNNYAGRPALYAVLELEYADRTEVIVTDEEFRTGTGPVRANGIYAGEDYDARLEQPGWDRAGFDDSAWTPARRLEWNLAALDADAGPPIRRIEELAPAAVTTSPSGAVIVDFGQNIAGWVRLTVTGEAGTTVTLRHAELLTPQGELEPETLRLAAATDRYTLRGGGQETWEPGFTFHGFRYVQVDGWPGELTAGSLRAVVVHSDMARAGWLETSDELVNRLHANAVWSMRGNFVGLPTDCPQRDERLGWTGDINAFTPAAVYLYDVRGVLGSWLKDLAAEQEAVGTVPWTVPDVIGGSAPAALWSDVAVSLPWALYQEYGDPAVLRDSYASMTAFTRQVEGLLDADGLWSAGFQFGDWLDPDAPVSNPSGGKTNPYLVAAAYLCKTTREMAATAELLGEDADAGHFAGLAARVLAAFRREFVTPAGRVAGESAAGYALALAFGLLEESQRRKAGGRLAELVREAGYAISTGFAGTPVILHALSATGHLDEAYGMLMRRECPSFLYPVTMGATTIWERWDSVQPDGAVNVTGMTSLNHYALGAVVDWLHRVPGGLVRGEPGWRTLVIAPQPGGGLTSARAVHDTVLGRAESSWRMAEGQMTFDVVVPEGATADVIPPLHPDSLRVQVGGGAHSWRYPLPAGPAGPAALTMDTPLGQIARHPAAWEAVAAVLSEHVPVAINPDHPRAASVTLNGLVQRLPTAPEQLRDDLAAALAPWSGEPAGGDSDIRAASSGDPRPLTARPRPRPASVLTEDEKVPC
jgi:alpha-L-rhamnosidase